MTDFFNNLKNIVESVDKKPTIVNPDSKFVVVTYWWGHGNVNNNIARPCIIFYEDFIDRLINSIIKVFKLLHKNRKFLTIFIIFENSTKINQLNKFPKMPFL